MVIRVRTFHARAADVLTALGAVQPDPYDETIWSCTPGDTIALDRAGIVWDRAAPATVNGKST
jgi:hypothetical protein